MVSIFDENEEIVWDNISRDVDHILYQPNRILAYDIDPDGYLSYKSNEEYVNPLLVEMEVLVPILKHLKRIYNNDNNNYLTNSINKKNFYLICFKYKDFIYPLDNRTIG